MKQQYKRTETETEIYDFGGIIFSTIPLTGPNNQKFQNGRQDDFINY